MNKIKVFIVDDSAVIRRLLSDALSADPMLEIVGTASNGRIALSKLDSLQPDIVTLDIEMPELDGLATLVELRKTHRKLPVIMFSTLTERGASATLDALARGATDYVTKPANVGSVQAAFESVQSELIPKIKALCSLKVAADSTKPAARVTPPLIKDLQPLKPTCLEAVVIGSSTGGPNALSTILPAFPADFPVPVLVVQHMPPVFTTHLASRLNDQCSLEVREAKEGDVVAPGGIWIAPGNHHMTLARVGTQLRVALNQNVPECSCRPAVDVLFRSAATIFGASALTVVLTGMGQDGTKGATLLRQAGGRIIAQDEATSVVWGMPGSLVREGLAHHVLPLDRIAEEIIKHSLTARKTNPLMKARV
jgi:two-component system chemotaxis response regulator CheB